jgi:predicted Rossmann-fold nucleotide-binding protein
MLEKIISGGQSGADQAGWRAARPFGIPTGGAMPKGHMTEEGPRPEFAERYGAVELPTDDDTARTERNVRDSDGTIWFGLRLTRQ